MSVFRKASAGLALTVSLFALASTARANEQIVVFGQATGSQAVFTQAGNGGTLSINNQQIDITDTPFAPFSPFVGPALLDIDLVLVAGSATPTGGGNFVATIQPGSFTITDLGGVNTILSGSFQGGILSRAGGNLLFGTNPNNATSYDPDFGAGLVTEFNLRYNGGIPFPLVGNFNLSFSSVNPLPTATAGGGLSNNFVAQFSGNADATAGVVPEPGEWAAMGILATGLGGLVVRARRRTA